MLRTILLIIGVIIILAIAWDGWRRKQRANIASSKIEPMLNDAEQEAQPADVQVEEAKLQEWPKQEEVVDISVQSVVVPATDDEEVVEIKQTVDADDEVISAEEDISLPAPSVEKQMSKPIAEIAALTVMSSDLRTFAGYDIIQSLESNALHFGEKNIYHRHKYKNGKGPLYFSVASVVKPGEINPKKLGELSTPGLLFFMELENPKHDQLVFKQMLAAAHEVAKALKGVVCDEKRVPLSKASMRRYQEKIQF